MNNSVALRFFLHTFDGSTNRICDVDQFLWKPFWFFSNFSSDIVQSAGAIEYTNCKTPPKKKCPGYDTKQSDGKVRVILEYPFIAIAPRSTLAWSGSTW